jgi:hypothetical protein
MGKRKNAALYLDELEFDENFQFIAGYTEGGAPFGITWEEAKLMEEQEKLQVFMKNEGVKNCENPWSLRQEGPGFGCLYAPHNMIGSR